MLTIFTVAEPFHGAIRRSRENALASWRRLGEVEIIAFGGNADLASYARASGIRHVPEVKRTDLGTPLLDDVFATARQISRGSVLMFSNCDMLYFPDLLPAIERVPFEKYLLTGRRWCVDVEESLAVDDDEAWESARSRHGRVGWLDTPSAMDYFIFRARDEFEMKPFVVGRHGWDSWLAWSTRMRGVPLIDGTAAITAIHQNHDYNHLPHGPGQYFGPEWTRNIDLAGGQQNMLCSREADWILDSTSVRRPPIHRRLLANMALRQPYRWAIGAKRRIERNFRLATSSG